RASKSRMQSASPRLARSVAQKRRSNSDVRSVAFGPRLVAAVAMGADQRDEDEIAEVLLLPLVAPAREPRQDLVAVRSERNDDAAAVGQLFTIGRGQRDSAGVDDDGIEGSLIRQAERAVGHAELDIG